MSGQDAVIRVTEFDDHPEPWMVCSVCGDLITWCPDALRRWPELDAHRPA